MKAGVILAAAAACAAGQPNERAMIFANDGVAGDIYGYACATNGETVAVAAPYKHVPTDDEGAIHIYKEVGGVWTRTQRLVAANRFIDFNLGTAIAMDGPVLVAGTAESQAIVFEEIGGTWVETATLTAPDAIPSDLFSLGLEVDGDRIFVGSLSDVTDAGIGSVYVYERADGGGWALADKIELPRAGATLDNFDHGIAIDASGDEVVIGRCYADITASNQGVAWVFAYTHAAGWALLDELVSPNPTALGLFGHTVALKGDIAIVGEPRYDPPGADGAGRIFEFTRSGSDWVLTDEFSPEDAAAGDDFAIDLDFAGDRLVVGAYLDDFPGAGSGSVYLLKRDPDGWVTETKFKGAQIGAGDLFGWDVDVADGVLVVAAPFDGTRGLSAGAAVIFDNLPTDPTCPADLTGSSDPNDPTYGVPDGAADAGDFFYYLDQFALGNLVVADLTGSSDPNDPSYGTPNGVLDAGDFFFYLDRFAQGCL